MAAFDRISDFVKSGHKRYEDAQALFSFSIQSADKQAPARHARGVMYLAGYGVECLLKAYLIDREQCQSLADAQDKINRRRRSRRQNPIKSINSSAAGHNIVYLIGLTDLPTFANYDPELWGRIGKWKSSWRYDPKSATREDAEAFLADVKQGMNIIAPRIMR